MRERSKKMLRMAVVLVLVATAIAAIALVPVTPNGCHLWQDRMSAGSESDPGYICVGPM